MSARGKAALVSALVNVACVAVWFGMLALSASPGQGDCPGVTPPAAVPGPPVVVTR